MYGKRMNDREKFLVEHGDLDYYFNTFDRKWHIVAKANKRCFLYGTYNLKSECENEFDELMKERFKKNNGTHF